jgi:hypothetical protein
MPATSRRPPIPPNALMRDVLLLFVIPVPAIPAGMAGAMGRMEDMRLGGLPGVSGFDFCKALSSHEDLVGDHLFRAKLSVLMEAEMVGGVGDRSCVLGVVWREGGEEGFGEVGGEKACIGGDLCCGGVGICSSMRFSSEETSLYSPGGLVETDFSTALDTGIEIGLSVFPC